jgi:hypothetical protein
MDRPTHFSRAALSYTIPKLAELLLVVIRRKSTNSTENKRHGSSTSSLDDPRHSGAGQQDTVCESKLGTVVLVVLEKIACILLVLET